MTDFAKRIGAEAFIAEVVAIAIAAGEEIMRVYAGAFAVEAKTDGSPVTQADRRAHDLIAARLQQLDADIPLLSEESDADAFAQRRGWKRFWLVDPLDGTKGFVRRTDDFTVNIALIEHGRPVIGVVHAPVQRDSYYARAGGAAHKRAADGATTRIRVRKFERAAAVMAASRSHARPRINAYRARLAEVAAQVDILRSSSSIKICWVAEGRADVYPRLGPTSEWDSAAPHCVIEAAGGSITDVHGAPLRYNKDDILNPWFVAGGDPEFDWAALARGID